MGTDVTSQRSAQIGFDNLTERFLTRRDMNKMIH